MAVATNAQQDETVYDQDINVVSFEDLAYPQIPLDAQLGGTVVVAVTLDEQGRVASASAVSGASPLIPACLENVKKWKFAPNKQKRAIVVYNFEATGTCRNNTRSLFQLKTRNLAAVTGCVRRIDTERDPIRSTR